MKRIIQAETVKVNGVSVEGGGGPGGANALTVVESKITGGSAASGVYSDLTSISLEPGTYLISGMAIVANNSGTNDYIAITKYSGNNNTSIVYGQNASYGKRGGAASPIGLEITPFKIVVTTTETWYLKATTDDGGSASNIGAAITAIKIDGIGGGGVALRSTVYDSVAGAHALANMSGNYYKMGYNTVDNETETCFNTGTKRFVIPVSITTQKHGFIFWNAIFDGAHSVYTTVFKNGVLYKYGSYHPNGVSHSSIVPISGVAGDYFEIVAERGGGATQDGNATFNTAELVLFADVGAAAEPVGQPSWIAHAYQTGDQSFTGGSVQNLPYNFKTDPGSIMNITGGVTKFTVPLDAEGIVRVKTKTSPQSSLNATVFFSFPIIYRTSDNVYMGAGDRMKGTWTGGENNNGLHFPQGEAFFKLVPGVEYTVKGYSDTTFTSTGGTNGNGDVNYTVVEIW